MRQPAGKLAAFLFAFLLFSSMTIAQTLTYHLDNPSGFINQWLLSTTSPNGSVWSLNSQSLSGAAPGEYFIASFPTAAGDPGKVGTISSGTTVTFTISMQESKTGGTVFPRAKLYLNSTSGTLFCIGTGTTAITSTATQYTFSCSTTAAITMASTDRFFLWVGVNLTKAPGGTNTTANVLFNGPQGGVDDSTVVAPIPPPPTISSLSVTSGNAGTPVTISGTHFGSTTGTVTFNGVSATVSSWNDGTIGTSVPTLASTGNVVVTNAAGSSNGVNFTVPPPAITSLSTSSGLAGTSVTITGAHFGATQGSGTVTFNGTAATISSWSDGSISTSVPVLATSGNVVVTAANGEASSGASFTVPAPSIASLSVNSGLAGTAVTITGSNFAGTQGTPTVTFNGKAATISSFSSTSISTSVPALASSGNVVVTAANGVASNGVSFAIPAPSITNVYPDSGRVGASITISGSNFGSVQGSLTFNGTAAAPTSWNNTQIVAPVPNGATTGPVVVTQGGASNSVSFTVDPPPSISSISPTSGPANTSVTVSGAGFGIPQGTSTIQFNGTAATPFSWSDGTIIVSVPVGATTGAVVVSAGGTNSNGVTFTVTPGPSISGLSITSGAPGTAVTISGQNFGSTQGSSVVRFNGLPAAVTSWSGGSIGVTVPSGVTTGPVTVTVSGQASNGVTFTAVTTGTLSGTVSSSSGGAAISGATVQALQNGAVKGSATTASNGSYSIANLVSGNYDVQASASGFGTALTNSVAVTAGQTSTANFSLSSPGTISGKVTQSDGVTAIPSAGVQYFVGSAAGSTTTTDATGSYSITGLNAGLYSLEAGASGYVTQSQTANVTGGNSSTANFSLQAVGAKPVNYVYDELGRLVSVIDSSGDTAAYKYDAVGNILSISRQNSSQLSLISFTPRSGTSGATVTIYGTGFSPTASQDSVSFNGVSATAASATATQITVTVPATASTGPITVTTPSGSASSNTNFTVLTSSGAPTITSFTPNMGASGTAVAITGTNFDIAANDRVTFNTSYSATSSVTTSQVNTTVPSSTGSGRISVATPAGAATSAQDFYIPFGSHVVTDIGFTGRMALGTTQSISVTPAGKIGLMLFDANQGQRASAQTSGGTFSSCTVYLFDPHGNQLTSANCSGASSFLDGPTLSMNGTYTLGIDPGGGTGSFNLTLNNATDVTGPITPGTPVNLTTTVPGQDARYTFNATAGQQASISLANSTYPNCPGVWASIVKPDGTTLGIDKTCNNSTGFVDSMTLPVTGTYTLLIDPAGTNTGSVSVTLNFFADVTGPVTAGTAINLTTPVPGQNARYTFNATAGQQASISLANSTYPNCPGVWASIVNPDGSTLGINKTCNSSTGFVDSMTLPATGTYTLLLDPAGSNTGSVTVTLNFFADVTGTIASGTPVNLTTTVPGQNALYTFSGTAGQQASVSLTNSTYTGCLSLIQSILNPSGTTLGSSSICNNNAGSLGPLSLSVTGTYKLLIDPQGTNTGSTTITLTLTGP